MRLRWLEPQGCGVRKLEASKAMVGMQRFGDVRTALAPVGAGLGIIGTVLQFPGVEVAIRFPLPTLFLLVYCTPVGISVSHDVLFHFLLCV